MNRFIFWWSEEWIGVDRSGWILSTELMSSSCCFYVVGSNIRFNFPMMFIGQGHCGGMSYD